MKYFLIAGEASGDLHGGRLIKALREADKDSGFCYLGGDFMEKASGAKPIVHYKKMAYMAFSEVLRHLPEIFGNMRSAKNALDSFHPDAVILIDYPSFNLKIAKYAYKKGIPVYYYISPKVWAWKEWRVKEIKKYVRKVLSILPFETEFYRHYDYPVYYGGNPLVDAIASRPCQEETFADFIHANGLPDRPIIALLAGSRKQELKYVLPMMLRMVPYFPEYQFVIAGAPSMAAEDYAPYVKDVPVHIVYGETYRLVSQAKAALVTSGTATLETALLRTPQVVCYNGEAPRLSYFLFKTVVKVKYISLVNLIYGGEAVKELMMQYLTEDNLRRELSRILTDASAREKMLNAYDEIIRRLGAPGASARFAGMMVEALRHSS